MIMGLDMNLLPCEARFKARKTENIS